MTVVVDHDTGRLVWAAAGRDKATLRRFFDALGADRWALITHVSADAADWIADVVAERCPGAIRCAVPRHRVGHRGTRCRTAAGVERRAGTGARRADTRPGSPRQQNEPPRPGHEKARRLKGARYALWKTPRSSPNARVPNWSGPPRLTPGCTAPTCSKRACGTCSQSRENKARRPWTGGSAGPGAAASRCSLNWPAASFDTAGPSTPPSSTAFRKD